MKEKNLKINSGYLLMSVAGLIFSISTNSFAQNNFLGSDVAVATTNEVKAPAPILDNKASTPTPALPSLPAMPTIPSLDAGETVVGNPAEKPKEEKPNVTPIKTIPPKSVTTLPSMPIPTNDVAGKNNSEHNTAPIAKPIIPLAQLPKAINDTPAAKPNNSGLNKIIPAKQPIAIKETPSQKVLGNGIDEIFKQMTEIERQNSILTLKLKEEQIQSEIDAIKLKREMAKQEAEQKIKDLKDKENAKNNQDKITEREKALKDELDASRLTWEKEKADLQKIIDEQMKRQEENKQMISEIKDSVYNERKIWLKKINDMKDIVENMEQEKNQIATDAETKIAAITSAIKSEGEKLSSATQDIKETNESFIPKIKKSLSDIYENTRAAITSKLAEIQQIPNLDASISNIEQSFINNAASITSADNPFLNQEEGDTTPANELYAVTEVRGTTNKLVAKLVTADGNSFFVKKGTALGSGHTVEEITKTYVKLEKKGKTEYIGFPAGGVLEKEPTSKIKTNTALGGFSGSFLSETGGSTFSKRGGSNNGGSSGGGSGAGNVGNNGGSDPAFAPPTTGSSGSSGSSSGSFGSSSSSTPSFTPSTPSGGGTSQAIPGSVTSSNPFDSMI